MLMLPPMSVCNCCHRKALDVVDVYPVVGKRVTLCLPCWLGRHDQRLPNGAVGLTANCERRLVLLQPSDPDDDAAPSA